MEAPEVGDRSLDDLGEESLDLEFSTKKGKENNRSIKVVVFEITKFALFLEDNHHSLVCK